MMLGLGLTAFAGPLSGSWASSLVVAVIYCWRVIRRVHT
jgi:hypothetical protein